MAGKEIKSFEAESGLKEELERTKGRERDLEDTRRAMTYLLEDINESSALVEKAKKEIEAVFDAIPEPFFIHDSLLRIVRCNRAYTMAAGVPYNEIIGRFYYEVFPKAEGPFRACSNIGDEHGREDLDEVVEVPEIGKVYRVRFFLTEVYGDGRLYFHVMEDITEERRARQKERLLYEFGSGALESLEAGRALELLCATAVEFGCKMSWAGVFNEASKEIIPAANCGFENGYLSALRLRDSSLAGPAEKAVKNKSAAVQNRIITDPALEPWRAAALKMGFRSAAAFPVMDGERVMAVLSVYGNMDEFKERDVDFLKTLAQNAASHYKNSLLFSELKRSSDVIKTEMELTKNLLRLAGAIVSTADMEVLMEESAKCVLEIMGCKACLSYLWDSRESSFKPMQAAGLEQAHIPLFRSSSLDLETPFIKKAFEARTPFMERFDTAAGMEPFRNALGWLTDISSAAVIPLLSKKDYLGLIVCVYAGGGPKHGAGLNGRERQVMGGISHQVSTALAEAILYRESVSRAMELSRKVATIQTMHEIDSAILSTVEPDEIIETVIRMIAKVIPCDRATLALADRERGGLTVSGGFGSAHFIKGAFVRFEDTSASEVLFSGRPQYVHDLGDMKGPLPADIKILSSEGFLSHIRVPLMIKGEAAGVLTVGSKRPSAFGPEDLSTLDKLSTQIGVALENTRLLKDLEDLFLGTVKALSEAMDAKSPWTRGHSERVTKIALELGLEMGLGPKELKDLELVGLLHDIGKIESYESILEKPGPLTEEEALLMRQHPEKGSEILSSITQMKEVVPAIRHHHEFYDGSGYPDGLKGADIPLSARILAVADTVDAMGTDRPYRKGRSKDEIAEELKKRSGAQFDPAVVEAYLKTIGTKA